MVRQARLNLRRTHPVVPAAVALLVLAAVVARGWQFWNEPPHRQPSLPLTVTDTIRAFRAVEPRIQVVSDHQRNRSEPDLNGITNLEDRVHHLSVTLSAQANQVNEATLTLDTDEGVVTSEQRPLLQLFLQQTTPRPEQTLEWVRGHVDQAMTASQRTVLADRQLAMYSAELGTVGTRDQRTVLCISVRNKGRSY